MQQHPITNAVTQYTVNIAILFEENNPIFLKGGLK